MDVDYGSSHMGVPIYFGYASDTLPPMATIGDRIRERRKALGIDRQADVAARVGIHQSTLSDIERGANTKPEVLLKLCEVLETTPEYLVRGVEKDTSEEAQVLAIYRSLSATQRPAMIAMARSLQSLGPVSGESPSSGRDQKPERKRA